MGFGKDQRIEFENRKDEYTLGDAIKDHTYDMELLANKYGSQHALARLYASGLENHFKWFKGSRNHQLIVTGHTHNPYLSRMRREKPHHSISDDVVYANGTLPRFLCLSTLIQAHVMSKLFHSHVRGL